MWYFSSPSIVFGDGALTHLEQLSGKCAFIVTDENLIKAGLVDKVIEPLSENMQVTVYSAVEPDPSLQTARLGAAMMSKAEPDWIVAVGGGSVMDAAKAMWILYEHPELEPEAINPIETLHLRQKARFVAIPTTSGTGSEATWAIVLTDPAEQRKLGLGNREAMPDLAILDPELVMKLPPRITADTGLDALTHAIEGYTSAWHNDFSDGLCIHAFAQIFKYLPAAYHSGDDFEARVHMQNAAAIAGLGFGNSMAALAHGLGHALGGVFHVPHGRAVALFLPYAIDYSVNGEPGSTRYAPLARSIGLPAKDELEAAASLVTEIRKLECEVGQPLTIAELGISREALEENINLLASNALNDTQTIMNTRVPEMEDLKKLFRASFDGQTITF